MTLWFDVTDIRDWKHSYLTGIQRTAVNVLSELLKSRDDVRLFTYVRPSGPLRQVDINSLPPAIQIALRGLPREAAEQGGTTPGRRPADAPKGHLRHRVRRWIGDEATEALRDFWSSGAMFARIIWRKARATRTAKTIRSAIPRKKYIETKLFQPGDICVSLSATWGLSCYGDVIAASKLQGRVKCVNLIYDLIPTLFPQWMLPGYSEMVTRWAEQQMANADVILTISNFQKREISNYMEAEKIQPRPIEVIRLGDDPGLLAEVAPGEIQPLPHYVPRRRFVICVSSLDIRKNQALLYQVWQRLSEALGPDCPELLLIGTPQLYVSNLLHQIRTDRLVNKLITHLPDVVDEELAWYYKNCAFTIYPSMYEGWGLPISESLSLGRYCIAGNRTSLPEAGGDLVDYFDPFDFAACYKLVYRAVTDPDYVRQHEERIRTNYVRYGWAQTAAHISKIADRLADPGGSPKDQSSATIARP